MNWREFLTDAERERLDELKAENRRLKDEHRRIYDRCRKRMARDEADENKRGLRKQDGKHG